MSKPSEPEHPMELSGAEIEGDLGLMIDSIIEEYASIGWQASQIMQLFEKPFFQSTYNAARVLPPELLRDRIDSVLARCGVVRLTLRQAEEPPEDDNMHDTPKTDLVQIRSRSSNATGDSR
jgi:hypothetical protein